MDAVKVTETDIERAMVTFYVLENVFCASWEMETYNEHVMKNAF